MPFIQQHLVVHKLQYYFTCIISYTTENSENVSVVWCCFFSVDSYTAESVMFWLHVDKYGAQNAEIKYLENS